MSAIQIAAKVEGDVVTTARAEFDRLVEMIEEAQDVLSTDMVQRKLALGDEETVPAAFVDRMLDGESLIRLWREHRGMTEAMLARNTGLSATDISDIEEGRREATVGVLEEIARALRLSLDDLVR